MYLIYLLQLKKMMKLMQPMEPTVLTHPCILEEEMISDNVEGFDGENLSSQVQRMRGKMMHS